MGADTPPANSTSNDAPQPAGETQHVLGQRARVWLRWLRHRAAIGLDALARPLKHAEVMNDVEADGVISGRYVFMVVMACAIAILGLLLSSPAVVIGAMLISPLMGPIMLLGFSLCALDYAAMRKALVSLAAGVAGALAISIIIVTFSPLREATPEILARTRPNLFDLLVAIFSGLAGGYSVIHRKGATIVGVAIATALMPPLAVVGFGVATGNIVIAGGAFFLFMTNLLAIALTVTGLAWLHGFATVHSEKAVRWQTALVVAVFAGLSLPLGFALRDIAYEARVQNLVRAEALKPFGDQEAEVSGLTVSFPRNEPIHIQQTVLIHEQVPDAEAKLVEHYKQVLKAPVNVRLNQVLVDQDKPIDAQTVLRMAEQSMAPLQRQIAEMSRQEAGVSEIRSAVSFPTLAIDADADKRTVVIVAAPNDALTVSGYRAMEAELGRRFPGWKVAVTPPMRDLPRVTFERGSTLSDEGKATLDDVVWALNRWGTRSVEVTGYASLGGSMAANTRLALARAKAVSDVLQAAGVQAEAVSGYIAPGQPARERELGKLYFQSAGVSPKG
jgi:uncharacterized hydrophobic protein (TIGR00271 family)